MSPLQTNIRPNPCGCWVTSGEPDAKPGELVICYCASHANNQIMRQAFEAMREALHDFQRWADSSEDQPTRKLFETVHAALALADKVSK